MKLQVEHFHKAFDIFLLFGLIVACFIQVKDVAGLFLSRQTTTTYSSEPREVTRLSKIYLSEMSYLPN